MEQAIFPAYYKFKMLYVNFFVNLYSILRCQVHRGLTEEEEEEKKPMSWWIRLLRILCLGGK